jgi:hypothetical protein
MLKDDGMIIWMPGWTCMHTDDPPGVSIAGYGEIVIDGRMPPAPID